MSAHNVSKTFGSGHTQVLAVDNVNLEVYAGELILIMGPSGSGKTSLLSILGALLKPSSGRVIINGIEISALNETELPDVRARNIGFVFQAFNLLEALTVEENILFPAQLIAGGIPAARERGLALIEKLGLTPRRHALPSTLSGGEKQRTAIARALINQPLIILADEPTGNLDSQSGQDVMMVLHDIAKDEGRSVLMVTHDPRVEDVADRILWLEDGRITDRQQHHHQWTHCPVCNMNVDALTARYQETRDGIQYFFCSERCLRRFEEASGADTDTYR